jgi:hypothetical protein
MANSAEQLRVQILGDSTNVEASLDKLVGYASNASERIGGFFSDLGGIITSSFAVAGITAAIDKGMDLASQQQSLQAVQAQLIRNQKMTGSEFLGSLQTVAGSVSQLNQQGEQYSKTLDAQATAISLQTGIAKNQVIQAQNLLLPNQDLANLFEKQNDSFQKTTMLAANLSAVMGGGGGGGSSSIVGATRMITRVLADPAKHMSAMTRYGITLSQTEQARIKSLESSGGLLAAQNQFLIDMNVHTQQLAEKSMSPVERMQNDIMMLAQALGTGLLPILDQMAGIFTVAIQPLVPLFQLAGQAMANISASLGQAIGNLVTAFTPLLTLFVQGFVPALVQVVTPILQFFASLATTFSNLFNKKVMTDITTFFTDIATQVVKNLKPGLDAVVNVFNQMANNGTLMSLLTAMLSVFQALGPILPTIATSLAQILTALAPLITIAAKWATMMITVFATALRQVVGFFDGITKYITHFTGMIKGIGVVLLGLGAIWFGNKLFLQPIKAIGEGITGLITQILRLDTVYGRSGALGGLLGKNGGPKGMQGFRLGKASGQKELSQRELNEMRMRGEIPDRTWRTLSARLQTQGPLEKAEYRRSRLQEIPGLGRFFGGQGGDIKNWLLGPETAKLQAQTDHTDALDQNTQAIINMTNKVSGSSSPLSQLVQQTKNGGIKGGYGNLEKDFSEAKKLEGLGSEAEGVVGDVSKVGGIAEKIGGIGSKFGGLLGGGEGAISGIAGDLLGGGGMGGMLASVGLDAIPGIGEAAMAVQGVAMVAPLIAKHMKGIETGFKDAGKFAEGIGKSAEHVGSGILHGIGHLFGGLFGGGGGSAPRRTTGSVQHLNIAQGAVVIHVNASGANENVAGVVKREVEASFNSLLANLKATGR